MKKKELILTGAAFILLLGGAFYVQRDSEMISANGSIERSPAGGADKKVQLYLEAEGLPKDYLYDLTVEPARITEELAEQLFAKARKEIDESFYRPGEDPEHVSTSPLMQDAYCDGLVEAEWFLDDYTCMDAEGAIREELLSEPVFLTARAEMNCGDYREIYEFSFRLIPRERTETEQMLEKLRLFFLRQYESGNTAVLLPEEIDGRSLQWKEKKEPYVWRVLLLEAAAAGLLYLVQGERAREQEKKRIACLEAEYPELVSRLAVLLGAGSSLKNAIGAIVRSYQKEPGNRPLYEEVVRMYREIADGESERTAYRNFGERCGCGCCLRLSRLLLQNLQTGNRALCKCLLEEADKAYEDRRLAARKAGEEAQTRLLLPLLMMMAIVMAIVIAPAILGFQL